MPAVQGFALVQGDLHAVRGRALGREPSLCFQASRAAIGCIAEVGTGAATNDYFSKSIEYFTKWPSDLSN